MSLLRNIQLPAARRSPRPERRDRYRAFPATVVEVAQLTPGMRRITLGSAQFTDYRRLRPDDFFGLLLPGTSRLHLAEDGLLGETPRGTINLIPEGNRPATRWYTVRSHRPIDGEIDVDIVLHGNGPEAGPGSQFATAATPGDVVGFCEANGLYTPPSSTARQIFFADETSLPALASILESDEPTPGSARLTRQQAVAHIEVANGREIQSINTDVPVHWYTRQGARPGSALMEALPRLSAGKMDYAWVCAEAGTVQQVRGHLRAQGWSTKQIKTCAYWRLGKARN